MMADFPQGMFPENKDAQCEIELMNLQCRIDADSFSLAGYLILRIYIAQAELSTNKTQNKETKENEKTRMLMTSD